ncbi:MAG TPA: hypothetical protein VGA85_02220 [Dehalococcoidales bacterium]
MLPELNDKNADIENVASKALGENKLLSELLAGLKSKDETFRYNCYKVLMLISKTHGEVLYPSWDYFVELLHSDNSYHKMSAVHLLTNLVKVDREDGFQKIFDSYYSLLDDKSVIVAIYVAGNSAQIVRAKPHLENRITNILLNIDKTHHPSGRKELIKAGAIEALMEYFTDSKNKANIVAFVTKQQDSESPKTRKIAKAFLKKWGDG